MESTRKRYNAPLLLGMLLLALCAAPTAMGATGAHAASAVCACANGCAGHAQTAAMPHGWSSEMHNGTAHSGCCDTATALTDSTCFLCGADAAPWATPAATASTTPPSPQAVAVPSPYAPVAAVPGPGSFLPPAPRPTATAPPVWLLACVILA